ncbi:hypothetical protein UVI_02017570 [Ustilaginoidea virens]|uniref:PAC domain-containing protein n=1 Tax=Ustilaginoidea virens TaxID=1159556 RepID=A0A1B5KT53_USTVR|nr:hypothetical protein UVI_02017570 [Ustilaginoidea virens]
MTPGPAEAPLSPLGATVPSIRSKGSNASLVESSTDSMETTATSLLPALQSKGDVGDDLLRPLPDHELDPGSFDIICPSLDQGPGYSLARRSELLFSEKHMAVILGDSRILGQFTKFLATVRPASLPLLTYYLDSEKAIRAIKYANSVTASLTNLPKHAFTADHVHDTVNQELQSKRDAAFQALTRDELPMFITHAWIRIVSVSIRRRIMGTLPSYLREASEGLAEVFCLTDPSRHDNPIILASSGRNCRFLQGPATNPFSVKRIRDSLAAGKEHFETFLNYRRDGSPFMNLLLCAPLIDSRGTVRYFLGAQVDVSGLAKECAELDGLQRLVQDEEDEKNAARTGEAGVRWGEEQQQQQQTPPPPPPPKSSTSACRDLSEMFNRHEVETVRCYGGAMRQLRNDDLFSHGGGWSNAPYLVIDDGPSPTESLRADMVPELPPRRDRPLQPPAQALNGRLAGIYQHYLLVRPAPSFQILFASPTLRVPGILQSPFLSRIGGSGRVRDQIAQAFAEGRGVTAKIRWLSTSRRHAHVSERGRPRWLHCTPMRGVNGVIGLWMIVIVDDEASEGDAGGNLADLAPPQEKRRPAALRMAPPIEAQRKPTSYITDDGAQPTWEG